MSKPFASQQSKLAAILISPEAPFPAIGGGALRTASLVHWLARKYQLDVIVFREPGRPNPADAFPEGLVRRISTIDLPFHSKTTAARAMRNFGRYLKGTPPHIDRFARFPALIEDALAGSRYSLGVIEHFWCAPYANLLAACCDRVALDMQNIESVLLGTSARAASWPQSVLLNRFADASRFLEIQLLKKFEMLLVPSDVDREHAAALSPLTPCFVIPNTIPSVPEPKSTLRQGVVFSGNLEYQPNIVGLTWFHELVWPGLTKRHPNLIWRIIGRSQQAIEHRFKKDPRIEVVGPVDNAIEEIAKAQLAVVPILSGSGTRVKIIEAWASGTPVVSTSLGAEGLQAVTQQHLIIADQPAAFESAVSSLLASPTQADFIGAQGRLLYEARFTWEAAWEALEKCAI